MQYITSDQMDFLKEAGTAITSIGTVWGLISRAITSSRNKMHEIVTENTNRVEGNLTRYIDTAFKAHEASAFTRLEDQEKKIGELQVQIEQLISILNKKI